MKISVIGDSFSSCDQNGSWTQLLSQHHELKNYSLNGICQYRILDIVTKNLTEILQHDAIIVWHTNPDRVYINDEIVFPTRKLASHAHADLVAADSLNSQDQQWQNTIKNFYKIFYNQTQQLVFYQLIFERIKFLLTKKKVIHCSGFDLTDMPDIKSFGHLLVSNPGSINHYDLSGNQKVFEYLKSNL